MTIDKKKKRRRVIPVIIKEPELMKILTKVKTPNRRLAFMLGFYQAMRVSEVVKLKPTDVDKVRRTLFIRNAKGGKDRIIPISPNVMKGLKHLPIDVGIRALQISIKKYGKDVLKKKIKFHTLRHSGATFYLNVKKWNLRHVQALLGHSKISTTELYLHVDPQDLINMMWFEDLENMEKRSPS